MGVHGQDHRIFIGLGFGNFDMTVVADLIQINEAEGIFPILRHKEEVSV